MILLVFDIDGTIAHFHTGSQALLSTLRHFKPEVIDQIGEAEAIARIRSIPKAGMTDPFILNQFLETFGLKAEKQPLLHQVFSEIYCNLIVSSPYVLCGQIESVIRYAAENKQIHLAVLSGNFSQTGWQKLKRVNLHTYFISGSFGSDAPKRSDLLPILLQRLQSVFSTLSNTSNLAKPNNLSNPSIQSHHPGWANRHSLPSVYEHIVIIGDTPQDIMVAKDHGCLSVAVASGQHSGDLLRQYQPDLLLSTWQGKEDVDRILALCNN